MIRIRQHRFPLREAAESRRLWHQIFSVFRLKSRTDHRRLTAQNRLTRILAEAFVLVTSYLHSGRTTVLECENTPSWQIACHTKLTQLMQMLTIVIERGHMKKCHRFPEPIRRSPR